MAFLSSELELDAFTNLLTAAAVNKRLLMRVLAHLEQKDLKELHEEVAHLNAEFRSTIASELREMIEHHSQREQRPPEPIKPGELPQGREEERRGNSLPNETPRTADMTADAPLGRDEQGG